jgi:hypothetical protein
MNEIEDTAGTIVEGKKAGSHDRVVEFLSSLSITVAGIIVLVALLGGCTSKSNGSYFSGALGMPPAGEAPAHGAEDKLGIRMEGLRLSAAGYIVDFRYRVTDPDKAAVLLDRKIRPYLLDEASGAQLGVPDTAKLGQLRTTGRNKVVPDQDYFILFANPGRYVQAGTRMTLVMGDVRLENLTVE